MTKLALALFFFLPICSIAELVSTGVGVVRGQVVTSREVDALTLIGLSLADSTKDKFKNPPLDSKVFAKNVQETLIEAAIALEAQSFNVVQLSGDEVTNAEKKVRSSLKTVPAWKGLKVTDLEFRSWLKRKLQAKKFIQFRAQSSVLPVTDIEAQKYFNENRLKFGNLPFENFKENIKTYLSREQVDRRLKDWYDLLLNKYQVKNLLAEI